MYLFTPSYKNIYFCVAYLTTLSVAQTIWRRRFNGVLKGCGMTYSYGICLKALKETTKKFNQNSRPLGLNPGTAVIRHLPTTSSMAFTNCFLVSGWPPYFGTWSCSSFICVFFSCRCSFRCTAFFLLSVSKEKKYFRSSHRSSESSLSSTSNSSSSSSRLNTAQIIVFWNVTPCSFCQTAMRLYHTTRRHAPEDGNLYSHSLKAYSYV